MPRTELRNLLPSSVVSDRSPRDVLQQLTMISSSEGASTPAGGASGISSEGIANLLQGSFKDVSNQLSALTTQLVSLGSVQQTQVTATQDNTQALTQNTAVKGSGSSVGSTIGGIASTFLGGGLGLSPIISGLISLFGGDGGSQTSTALPIFQLPSPVDYQGGLTSSGQVVPVDYGQGGHVRTQQPSTPTQVNVQVNAMDSKSFLDHSDEIASAVKAAILNSHSINDVLADL